MLLEHGRGRGFVSLGAWARRRWFRCLPLASFGSSAGSYLLEERIRIRSPLTTEASEGALELAWKEKSERVVPCLSLTGEQLLRRPTVLDVPKSSIPLLRAERRHEVLPE
ncbi:MAG: hypothetical protein WB565_18085 [Acidimicrobiales bacterium]